MKRVIGTEALLSLSINSHEYAFGSAEVATNENFNQQTALRGAVSQLKSEPAESEYNVKSRSKEPLTVYRPNFCVECGAQIERNSWRIWRGHFCKICAYKYRRQRLSRYVIAGFAILFIGFCFGRYLRPAPPPLIIQRSVNLPISDLALNLDDQKKAANRHSRTAESDSSSATRVAAEPDDAVYTCGARTRKGTPCRRRVHFAGERCYQHKGRPAMVPLEKLIVKDV